MSKEIARRSYTSRTALSATTTVAFLVLGWSAGLVGPALPSLTARWQVSLDAGGTLFTALLLGASVTVLLSGALLDRVGRKPLLVAGLFLMSVGLGGLSVAPALEWALLSTSVLGLGWGCLDVTLNVFAADLYPEARGVALNLLNMAFGIGALAGPLTVGWALEVAANPSPAIFGLGVVSLVAGFSFAGSRFAPRILLPSAPTSAGQPARWLALLRERYVILLVLMFFIYVGLEIGFGGWVYSISIQGANLEPGVASLIVAAFWTTFTLGRLGAALASRRVAGETLVLGGAGLAAAGAGLIAGAGSGQAALFVGAAMVGTGLAPIFPTAIGLATERYPESAGAVSSFVVFGGTVGGAILPYLVGRVLVGWGVAAAALCFAFAALAVCGIQLALNRSPLPKGHDETVPFHRGSFLP